MSGLDSKIIAVKDWCGVKSYWTEGATYVNDPEFGWLSVNGVYFDWLSDGRKGKCFDGIRWYAKEKEIDEIKEFIKRRGGK